MDSYQDRSQAGKILAEALQKYQNEPNLIILGLARGGVPVAYEIAKALSRPLEVFIVRKLGVPGQEELAMGAIASENTLKLNHRLIKAFNLSQASVDKILSQEKKELARREHQYRGKRAFPDLREKTVLVVDDGMATGASMEVAIAALQKKKVKKIIIALPVAPPDSCKRIAALVDALICPLQPLHFQAVGLWYQNFPQTADEEVCNLLKKGCEMKQQKQ